MSEDSLKGLKVVIEGDISKLKKSTADATRDVRKMAASINSELKAVRGPDNITFAGIDKQMSQIRIMKNYIKKSYQDMKSGAAIKGITDGIKNYVKQVQIAAGIKVPSDEWLDNEQNIEKCNNALDKLYEKSIKMEAMGAAEKSASWQNLQYDIEKVTLELDKLYTKEQRMETDGTAGDKSTNWNNLQKEITKAEASLARLQDREEKMKATGADQESKSWRTLQYDIQQAESKLTGYIAEKEHLESSGGDLKLNTDNGMGSRMKRIAAATKEIISNIPVIGKVARTAGSIGSKAFSGMLAAMKSIGPAIKRAAGTFASLIRKFASGIPMIRKFTSGVNANTGSFKKGFLTMLKYGLGIRSLFVLFNRLRSAVVSGFENLAQYDKTTNGSLSMLMSSLTQLKNALATAFAPILNVVAPLLNTLIQYVTNAVSALGMLFASLTGQKAYVSAKKVTQDYAAS
nr:hypothetical protein [Lachnospiraceae bacterium]